MRPMGPLLITAHQRRKQKPSATKSSRAKRSRVMGTKQMANDFMSGIEALPRWDPENLDKGYSYDWRSYNPKDSAVFKEARAERDQARQETDFKQTMRSVGNVIRDKINELVGDGTIILDKDSTCFLEVTWTP